MKKFVGVFIILLLIVCTSACTMVAITDIVSENQVESDAVVSDYVEDEKILSDSSEDIADEKDDYAELLSDEDILKELEGEYVNSLFIEEFKKTKSIKDAARHRESVAIRNESDGYIAYIGDGHQGTGVGTVDITNYVDGKYELYFEADESNSLKIVYTPGENVVGCEMKSDVEAWSTEGETIDFVHFASDDLIRQHLSCLLFDGIDGVDINSDGVYAEVYDIYYKIDVMNDINGVESNMDAYSGAMYLSCDNGENVTMKYQYADGKISLYDMNDTHVVTFE